LETGANARPGDLLHRRVLSRKLRLSVRWPLDRTVEPFQREDACLGMKTPVSQQGTIVPLLYNPTNPHRELAGRLGVYSSRQLVVACAYAYHSAPYAYLFKRSWTPGSAVSPIDIRRGRYGQKARPISAEAVSAPSGEEISPR
jgi:hypothetical protein